MFIKISLFKTTYSKQLIYTKQLIRISFFKTTCLCKTAYFENAIDKHSHFEKQLIQNSLFYAKHLILRKNNLFLKTASFMKKKLILLKIACYDLFLKIT